jgi:hypothetical protein
MVKKIKNKGELTTQQIVMLIILIVGFVVILVLLFRLNLGKTTDEEICHNSVVMRDRTKIVSALNCKTSYVCISGGDNCKEIDSTTNIEVNPTDKEEIMKAIADEMSGCWWMFGEGEIDYGSAWLTNYHCALCSVVKFDKKIQTEFSEISYKEFYDYLKNTKKDETRTYLWYLYGTIDVDFIEEMNEKIDIDDEKIFTSEKYVIVTGMKGNKHLNPYFIKNSEIKDKTECDIFDITKA